jgi:small nuclear ribonucleoprotein (snRNP)-like protein
MPMFKSRRPMKKKPAGSNKFSKAKKKGKKGPPKRAKKKKIVKPPPPSIESTGMESLYLKELIEDEKIVVVVLNSGEQVRGYIRYYDRDVFSIGPIDGGPKIFIRKTGVRYLFEE